MKLKSLLLGSAAALVAVSGARAADAIIAEPEPVEYVRVCDAYGAGYFYIPGTETCLKIGGFIRYQIDVTDKSDSFGKTTQANLSFSAKSDTEWGTLEGFVELTTSNGGSVLMDAAYISLGGLKMGWIDNAFDGGIVSEVDGLGGSKGNTIMYTFASGGFDATVSLDSMGAAETNFVPSISANAGFSAGAVAVRAFAAYDEEDDTFAAKLRLGADVTEGGKFEIAAVYADAPGNYSFGASEWSVAAGYSQKVSDTVKLAVGAQYWDNIYSAELLNGNAITAGTSAWAVGAHVDWTPVTNFLVRTQITYMDAELPETVNLAGDTIDGDSWHARIRFQRSF
jgi:Porin subfamily